MTNLMEELVPIPAASAIATAKALAAKEGLLTGISGGGTMWAALETAKKVRTLIHLPTCSLLHQLLLLKPAPIHSFVRPPSSYVVLRACSRSAGAQGLRHPCHAARHGRTLPLHAALC